MSISFISCNTYKKAIYFQDVNRLANTKEAIINFNPITIQPDDILGISSLNPESSAVFNFASNTTNTITDSYSGYTVDQNGNIQLPIIGSMNVANQTTSQIREKIMNKLDPYLKEPVVITKLLNFKISILGDVSNPGLFKIAGERLSVP